jgi:hypothetical protein
MGQNDEGVNVRVAVEVARQICIAVMKQDTSTSSL